MNGILHDNKKKITDMKSKGICPDCNGQGIIIFAYEYVTPDQCSGCNGSGSFKDWARTTNYYF